MPQHLGDGARQNCLLHFSRFLVRLSRRSSESSRAKSRDPHRNRTIRYTVTGSYGNPYRPVLPSGAPCTVTGTVRQYFNSMLHVLGKEDVVIGLSGTNTYDQARWALGKAIEKRWIMESFVGFGAKRWPQSHRRDYRTKYRRGDPHRQQRLRRNRRDAAVPVMRPLAVLDARDIDNEAFSIDGGLNPQTEQHILRASKSWFGL
ncbi:hypothetical protein FB451DRAFT_1510365 [Mycena latifolia]|nr:hypothetical protein FB451DRAFT_1510365 [Mycena latifolia]